MLSWRQVVVLPVIAILPVSLVAGENGATLKSNGNVRVNSNPVPPSYTVVRDDLIETPKDGVADLRVSGSTAAIGSETMVQYEVDELVLDHGTVSVSTARQLRVRVGCITVTPVIAEWTHFDVTDVDGKVTVSALKSDVYINEHSRREQVDNPEQIEEPSRSGRTIVRESETKSREEKCPAAGIPRDSGTIAARGAIMNSVWAKGAGLAGIGVLTWWALCQSDDPASPSSPKSPCFP